VLESVTNMVPVFAISSVDIDGNSEFAEDSANWIRDGDVLTAGEQKSYRPVFKFFFARYD